MMKRLLLSLLLWAGLCGATPRTQAFALYGEIPTWFTDQTGLFPGDIYGPMNLGEEYRWPVPQINYAFDASFLDYFGQRGVEEVEKAIQIINDLPSMSDLRLSDFPTFTMRVNYRARDLALFDLKSSALQSIMEELGLGSGPRFTYTLRIRDTPNNQTNYLVIMRNFDPETWQPTPYVNGQLWTYLSIFENQDAVVKASTIPEPVDPLILAEPVANGLSGFAPTLYSIGSYFTGLTRDDVGGLYYIYRPENRNVETLPADASGAAGILTGGSGGSGGSWTPIPAPTTNAGDTNLGGGIAFYPQGIRGGINKLRFVRTTSASSSAVYQPGAYSVTNRFEEQVRVLVTNGVERTINQRVTRVLAAPDILFSAQDLSTPTDPGYMARTEMATSNDGINGNAALDGPGQFAGPGNITFSKTGPAFFNNQPSFLAQPAVTTFFIWGSFDGSTNDPVVYPIGTSIRDIEQRVFGGR